MKKSPKDEPALVVGAVASALVALAAHWNIVIDQASLGAVLSPLLGAFVTRQLVSPTRKK